MTNQEIFAERLARLQSGSGVSKATVFVGTDETFDLARPEPKKRVRHSEVLENALYPLSIVGAFAIGLLSVAFGKYARFHVAKGYSLEDPDLDMLLTLGLGLLLSFVLSQMFRLTSVEYKAAQSAGVFAMVCVFHNFAHWAPGPMAVLFSSDHVAAIQSEAAPNSVFFRGYYFTVFEDGPSSGASASRCAQRASGVQMIRLENDAGTGAGAAFACD